MGFLTLLAILMLPAQQPSTETLGDFSRFSKAIGREIAIVDVGGTVRQGIVRAVTSDDVTLDFGSGSRAFPRSEVASAERLRDSRVDGAVKGALIGTLLGFMVAEYYDGTFQKLSVVTRSVALYGAIGYGLDAANTHREPLYRAAAPVAAPSVKMAFRF